MKIEIISKQQNEETRPKEMSITDWILRKSWTATYKDGSLEIVVPQHIVLDTISELEKENLKLKNSLCDYERHQLTDVQDKFCYWRDHIVPEFNEYLVKLETENKRLKGLNTPLVDKDYMND